jgi:ABC-type antimicrobial peptide transport system permease subunit
MSVLERTREFGMLLAVGMRPGAIGRMVWLELLALAFVGCAIGLGIGSGVTLWFENAGIEFAGLGKLLAQFGLPPRLYPTLTVFSALVGPSALLFTVLVGGIVPYLRVARLQPALATRAP